MPYLQTPDQTAIYYRDWGTGTPVVLIHGWPLNGDMWDLQAEFLAARGLRVITYDRRGFGRSSQPWDGYDYDTFASDLHVLMESLDLKNAGLIGFSMGGGEVARYLSRYGSSRVRRAILISAVTPFLLKTADNPDGIDAEVFQNMEMAIRKDRPAFLKDFGHKFYGRSVVHHTVSDALLEWTQSMAFQSSLHSMVAAAKAWSTTDFREDLKQIDIPCLVIHGTSDGTVPIEKSAHKTLELLPKGSMVEYDGEPHGLFITAAEKLNGDVLQFLESTAGSLATPRIADLAPSRAAGKAL